MQVDPRPVGGAPSGGAASGSERQPAYAMLMREGSVSVLLHPEAGPADMLRAFVHARLVADTACAHVPDAGSAASGSQPAGPTDPSTWRAGEIFMRMARSPARRATTDNQKRAFAGLV